MSAKSKYTYEELATIPFDTLEKAYKARKRVGVLERMRGRLQEKITKAEAGIKKVDAEIAELTEAEKESQALVSFDELKYQKRVEFENRLEQIDKLLFQDAKALGYQSIDDVLLYAEMVPEDFYQHIQSLMHEEQQIHEALEQLELPPNVVVFPLSKRRKYDKFTPFDGGDGPTGPRAA